MSKKLCIVGSQTNTRDLAPWDDPTFDIWVLNEAASKGWAKRVDAVFQLHLDVVYSNPMNLSDPGHWDWLQQPHDFPIYMQEVDPRVPGAVRYPRELVKEVFFTDFHLEYPDGKGHQADYFTSTFPFVLALAILPAKLSNEGPAAAGHVAIPDASGGQLLLTRYDEIHIYGIEMMAGTEYEYQVQCYLFWLGMAAGAGIKVVMHSGIHLFERLVYGYEGHLVSIDQAFLQERVTHLDAEWKRLELQHRNLKNKLSDAILENKFDKVADLIGDRETLCKEQGMLGGALGQAQGYLSMMQQVKEKTGKDFIIDRQACETAAAKAGLKSTELGVIMHRRGGMVEYIWNAWKQTGSGQASSQLRSMLTEYAKAAYDHGAMIGTYQEMTLYMVEIDKRSQAAGGAKTALAMQAQPAEVSHAQ